MEERMQKTLTNVIDLPQRDRTESEWYEGVQTFMWMTEDNIVEVTFDKEHLLVTMFANANDKVKQARHRSRGLRAPCREAPPRCFS